MKTYGLFDFEIQIFRKHILILPPNMGCEK